MNIAKTKVQIMTTGDDTSGKTTVWAGPFSDLPVGDTTIVKAKDREILIIRLETGIYALENSCIHGGCNLLHGIVEGGTLRCRCHMSLFDIKTGNVLEGPATAPQPAYEVIIENGVMSVVI